MITREIKPALLSALRNAFPQSSVRGTTSDDGDVKTMVVTVPEINREQLQILALVPEEVNMKLKRSGTSISIFFN
ncbi:MAG TPA: hypothetical protein VGB63_13235 [Pedobacter sp.]|jgi:hypothetical protein